MKGATSVLVSHLSIRAMIQEYSNHLNISSSDNVMEKQLFVAIGRLAQLWMMA
jgi:hypothetical protein